MRFNMKILSLHFVVRIISRRKQNCAASTAVDYKSENLLYESLKFDFRNFATLCGLNSSKKKYYRRNLKIVSF